MTAPLVEQDVQLAVHQDLNPLLAVLTGLAEFAEDPGGEQGRLILSSLAARVKSA